MTLGRRASTTEQPQLLASHYCLARNGRKEGLQVRNPASDVVGTVVFGLSDALRYQAAKPA
jgi:hypothetical protein